MIRWSNMSEVVPRWAIKDRELSQRRSISTLILLPGAFLYLATALLGVWAARDQFLAWLRFLSLAGVVVALLLASMINKDTRRYFWRLLGPVAALLGTLLAMVFLVILRLLHVQSYSLPLPISVTINADTIDGLLPLLFPLALAGLWHAWQQKTSWLERIGMTVAILLMSSGILFSTSRSVFLSLLAGGGGLLYIQLRTRHPFLRRLDTLVYIVTPVAVGITFLFLITKPDMMPGFEILDSRLSTWRNMSLLVVDYPFIGSGLVGTDAVYSAYVHLVHVPYLYHAYNLYLQIAIEQGILGTAGFLWLAACAVWYSGPWRAKEWTFHRAAVHASIITLLVYGLFDSETYESVLMPLSFIPIGAAFALTIEPAPVRDFVRRRMRSRLNIIGICLMIAVPLGLWFHPASIEARWHANLGAVSQTRVELRYYEWPKWPIQDLMRLQYKTELAQARQHYQQALGINPQEPVANRRLGQIELSLGEYASAQQHLENAYTAMPRHRAARQLLGESYAIAGDVEKAADLWRGMEFRQNQLSLRGWWYQFIGENQLAAHIYNAQTLSGH